MSEWIYFIHAPREHFAETLTAEEAEAFHRHFAWLQQRCEEGVVVLAGPTLGEHNTGICIFEADDEEAARAVMAADPVIAGGYATGELRGFRVSVARSR